MKPVIYLEGSYTPKNYFEEPLLLGKEGYRLEIDTGKVKAILDEKYQESDSEIFNKIHKEIDNYFQAIQIVTHKSYILSFYSLNKVYPDGRKSVTAFQSPGVGFFFGGSADI